MAEITEEQSSKSSEEEEAVSKTALSSPSYLETPEGRKLAYHKLEGGSPGVVFIHGIRSDMNGIKACALEEYCRDQGKAYVRFDLSGHGQSSEEPKDCNISIWLEDLIAVLESLTQGPQVLIGNSIGGWLMFLYTMRNPDNVSGLIGVSAAPDFTQQLWKSLDKDTRRKVQRSGVYKLATPYSEEPYDITMDLIQDGEKYTILDMPGIEYIKVPIWLFHGEQDTVVPPSTALQIMQRLQCPVSLKMVVDGGHRLSRPQDIKLISQALGALFNPNDLATSMEQED